LTEFRFDLSGRCFDLICVGNVCWDNQRFASQLFHFSARSLQCISSASEQTESRAMTRELAHGRAAHAGGGAGDYDNFRYATH
jgi:hypothetical protein